jgi:hypothetical protein
VLVPVLIHVLVPVLVPCARAVWCWVLRPSGGQLLVWRGSPHLASLAGVLSAC